ncbi:serine/threonine protein kinase [Cylindrospermum sp. FACHB-282]|uniref:serine/threonine protein kinase n=1 Tax=Cylindrospermum sp. FACHB-282 TaxID=2692794 RepID=UPI00168721B1|nr:serine/threonine-protein kinase [Cylindrospermum sp. FACHB-282]MBD2385392.1 serine/threonine protein kinase [Cylindrospermum sp. FACHB-282]
MTSQGLGDFAKEILAERYEVQQHLGKKAGRRTLLTRDLQTQELVVVKLLSFGDEFEWHDLKLFEREAETLKALSHPAIPSYLDYFELNLLGSKGFALVQSYIPAESLETQLKAGRSFSEEEVKQLATAILEILKYLHGRQPAVIHRDIKPSNILLTNRSGNSVGEVYLVDFGSVQTIVRINSTMTVVGSYGYMPPEQFNGRATPASDLYGLGATLIYLVTGQHPADLPQQDLVIKFEQAANITPGFSSWLRKMTQPILSRRLASAEQALQALAIPINKTQTPVKASNSVLGKPFGSKVILHKNTDFIEIIIPPVGGVSKMMVMFSWYFRIVLPLSFLMILPIFNMMSPLLLPVSLLILFFVVSMCLFGNKTLHINSRQISLCYELFGIERHYPLPSLKKYIVRLEKTYTYYNNKPQPCLIIWSGMQKYKIHTGENNIFSVNTLELDWLAEQISDWLGLPITKN